MNVVLIMFDLPKAIQSYGANVENRGRAEIHVHEDVDVAKRLAQQPNAFVDFKV